MNGVQCNELFREIVSPFFFFIPIVHNRYKKLFKNYFSHSCCVFALLHSSIACHKPFGINLKEGRKEITQKSRIFS